MGEMIIVNAPRAFHLAWKFACPMIDVGTVQKIRGLQEDPMQRLRELVEPQTLPRFLGGECECNCAGGCMSSDRGPWQDTHIAAELESAPQWEIWNRLANQARTRGARSSTSGDLECSLSARFASTLASPNSRASSRRQRCTWSPITDSWHSISASPPRQSVSGSLDSFASSPRASEVSACFQSMGDPTASTPASPSAASRSVCLSLPAQRRLPAMPEEGRAVVGTPTAREASYIKPNLGRIESHLSNEELGPLWQKIRRMEETYVSVLETWLAKASHLEGQGSIKEMQEAQRYFDTVAVAQHAQATVHTIASEFYALMAQHTQVAMELREAEARLERLRPQDDGAPNAAFVEQALRVSELSEALRKTQQQRDSLEGEFRRGVEDFRRARIQAVDIGGGGRRPPRGLSCCGCMAAPAAGRRSAAGRSGGGARGADPCVELQQAIAELEVDGIRRWHQLPRGLSEATTRSASAFTTSPSSFSSAAVEGGSSPSPATADDSNAAAVEEADDTAAAASALDAEPSEAGESFYTCEGEAAGIAPSSSSRPRLVPALLA